MTPERELAASEPSQPEGGIGELAGATTASNGATTSSNGATTASNGATTASNGAATGPDGAVASPAPARLQPVPGAAAVASQLGRRDRIARRLLACADLVGLLIALPLAAELTGNRTDLGPVMLLLVASLPAWLLLFKLYGLYDRDPRRISHSAVDDLHWLLHALLVGALLFWGLIRVTGHEKMIFMEGALFGIGAVLAILLLRSAMRRALIAVLGPERTLLVGTPESATELVDKIRQGPGRKLDPIGLLDGGGSHAPDAEGVAGVPRLGTYEQLEGMIERHSPDRVLICRTAFSAEQVLGVIDVCRNHWLKVGILPDTLESLGPAVEVDEIQGITMLGISTPVLSRTSRAIKRGFDLLVATPVLLLAGPLMAAIAVAVRLGSPGPAIFRQSRVGQAGRPFELLKFRTMVDGAEDMREELMGESNDDHWLDLDHDPRVTRLGRLLRRTSLDELPQLLNVIRGEMSLVGPRPLPEAEDANVDGRSRARLDLTPGITGLWQVLGRNRIPFDEMLKLDYLYVTNWSLWTDIRLLFRTLPAVLRRHGVN